MERFDVLVVGGGPAGSTTAYRLADAGGRVLLVDKATFPRDKPRRGGLTRPALRRRSDDARRAAVPGRPVAGRRAGGRPRRIAIPLRRRRRAPLRGTRDP